MNPNGENQETGQETGQEQPVEERSANPGYAIGQLAAAFTTSRTHEDEATRERAAGKIEQWVRVFRGMLTGALRVGSRTPVKDVPAWATLEVVRGGFATGGLLAGGALLPHEKELLDRLGSNVATPARSILNSYYLSEEGLATLQEMLASGRYRVNIPEEGALLVIAWLLRRGDADAARNILDEIGPYFERLRFYPVPNDLPLAANSDVHLKTVGETADSLAALQTRGAILRQREATLVWAPLYDRFVSLFLKTVAGEEPSLRSDPEGQPLRSDSGRFIVDGGWPCQQYPEGWGAEARALLDEYKRLRKVHRLCAKPDGRGENFPLLRKYAETCARDLRKLTGRDVGMIRHILAAYITRRGAPDSETCRRLREYQAALAVRPSGAELAKVVAERLYTLPPDDALESMDEALAPVDAEEAHRHGVPEGEPLASRLEGRVTRCLAAPIELLLERKLIPSAEMLARVIPQITAQVAAATLDDTDGRRLYGAVYRAFRRRRSLLLLNLQHQVKLEELPWVKALQAHRKEDGGARGVARETLVKVSTLAVTAFPHQIVPNKLLQELRALAKEAELTLPFVDEMAADIFMDAFTEKYLQAALIAADLLEGSLYEQHYAISYAQLRERTESERQEKPTALKRVPVSPVFYAICAERAGATPGGWSVARNGTIIEQEQILTTHNLAALFGPLGLRESLRDRLDALARACFVWICHRGRQSGGHRKARLRMVKNMAYAWRQMVFFLSLQIPEAVQEFLGWANEHLGNEPPGIAQRLRPALDGLARAAEGLPVEEDGARQFLGWSTDRHWLLSEP